MFPKASLFVRFSLSHFTLFLSVTEFNSLLVKLCDEYGANKYGLVRLWLGPFLPIVIICDAKAAQVNTKYYYFNCCHLCNHRLLY